MTTTTHNRVAAIIGQITGTQSAGNLSPSTPIINGGLHLDSVAILELLLALEKEFSIELAAWELSDAQALQTLSTMSDFIDKKLAGRTS